MPLKAPSKSLFDRLIKKRHGANADLFGSDRLDLMGDHRQQSDGPNEGTAPRPTVAAFSPAQQTASQRQNQKSVLIHQKSPLLVVTPPQVTRALAYSHPFILPLNHLVGLISWTTGDPWESFLLLTLFWFLVLYGDSVLRWAGPVALVAGLIFGMYSRRYSPLSSTVWSNAKSNKKKKGAESDRRKSLDEILETLNTFTGRCDVLLDPFLRLTEYLSTQSSATSATTRPALTTLFIRILAFTPIWVGLALPPLRIITTQRVVLLAGTTILSWHSRPARTPPLPPRPQDAEATAKAGKAKNTGVTFTFTVFENERRWWGLGWSKSLLTYERQAWTDDQSNECPDPEHYTLPETDNETTQWRWLPGSVWKIEGAMTEKEKSAKRIGGGGGGDNSGWTYYDNKWGDGRKEEGWGRYTRRRKWIRDAELVETSPTDDADGTSAKDFAETSSIDTTPISTTKRKPGWFGGSGGAIKRPPRQSAKNRSLDSISVSGSVDSVRSRASVEEDVHTPLDRFRQYDWDRSIHEDLTGQLS
ncbi:hypothetical protein LTR37_019396 [Vermiconidia calcicola]|uniref:Uncharacterized protein n=1 Tax=Vermiconidia calcicola TaxID=1690605 RepID=A0ACC3MEC9_9PEZI|nr:hypothetical protein LTR37_019396 [Vermiconidia calcicola]